MNAPPTLRTRLKPVGDRWELTWFSSDRSEWASVLAEVKAIPGRLFNPTTKAWMVPANEASHTILARIGWADLPGGTSDTPQPPIVAPEHVPAASRAVLDRYELPADLVPAGLRDYQLDFLRFMMYRAGRGLNGDEMGTGKTVQALAWLRINPDLVPALMIVTASTKIQWSRQYRKWTSGRRKAIILEGQTPRELDPAYDYIINWEILSFWGGDFDESSGRLRFLPSGPLCRVKWGVIVADEVQYAGNSKAKRTKVFQWLGKRAVSLLPMSGTPMRGKPKQFWTTLNLLDPQAFPNQWQFQMRYCDARMGGFGWTFEGASNEEELGERVSRLMIRRLKADVMKELPPKQYSVVPMSTENSPEYDAMLDRVMRMQGVNALEIRRRQEELMRAVFPMKRQAVLKWLEEFVATGEKLVVFFWHQAVGDYLQSALGPSCVRVDGRTSASDKSRHIQQFVSDPKVQVILGQLVAMGIGVDGLQQVCTNAAMVELIGSPADFSQAEDRLHRMGQEGSVTIHYLIAPGTPEEEIAERIEKSSGALNTILDRGQGSVLELSSMLKKGTA